MSTRGVDLSALRAATGALPASGTSVALDTLGLDSEALAAARSLAPSGRLDAAGLRALTADLAATAKDGILGPEEWAERFGTGTSPQGAVRALAAAAARLGAHVDPAQLGRVRDAVAARSRSASAKARRSSATLRRAGGANAAPLAREPSGPGAGKIHGLKHFAVVRCICAVSGGSLERL